MRRLSSHNAQERCSLQFTRSTEVREPRWEEIPDCGLVSNAS